MLLTVVVAHHGLSYALVAGIVADCGIAELVTVVMVMHVCAHISMVVAQIQRNGMMVVVRPVIPAPG